MTHDYYVMEKLSKITEADFIPLLNAKAEIDPLAGIIIVKLDIQSVLGDFEQVYDFYAARVLPKSSMNDGYVNPHYHLIGSEPYRFFCDAGEMNRGKVVNRNVIWTSRQKVSYGDVVKIADGEVHSFRNTGIKPADFVFACPTTHLCEIDRYFTKELKGGATPQ